MHVAFHRPGSSLGIQLLMKRRQLECIREGVGTPEANWVRGETFYRSSSTEREREITLSPLLFEASHRCYSLRFPLSILYLTLPFSPLYSSSSLSLSVYVPHELSPHSFTSLSSPTSLSLSLSLSPPFCVLLCSAQCHSIPSPLKHTSFVVSARMTTKDVFASVRPCVCPSV